jgi:Predicted spermidine synthase with an N-terminal membrane domain
MLELAVFLCGAVVMVLELTGSRVLAPFLGTSIIVWTSLIGVVLGSLSAGYWWGGRLADRRPEPRLLSRIILLAALATLLLAGLKGFLLLYLQNKASLATATLWATLVLFAPVSVLLGMVSPFAVRLRVHDAASSGSTAGNLYALSTLGSIAGTFGAGFWLTATLGTTNIILCMAGVLVAAAFCAYPQDLKVKFIVIACIAAMSLWLAQRSALFRQVGLLDLDTPYQRVLVFEGMNAATGELQRVLTTSPEGVQSAMDPADPTRLVLPYSRFYRLVEFYRPDAARVLMLGGGGYSYPKWALTHGEFRRDENGKPAVRMDVVELDPGMTEIARRQFALGQVIAPGDPRLTIHHDDARRFLNSAQASGTPYQVALVDVFTSQLSVPFHLATRETAQEISRLLDADGVVLVNCLSTLEGPRSGMFRALLATYSSVFPRVESFRVSPEDKVTELQNIILVGFKSATPPRFSSTRPEYSALLAARMDHSKYLADAPPPLTDDFAPVDHYLLGL